MNLLSQLDTLITENPPLEARGRFGNPAFKSWLHAVRTVLLCKFARLICV